MRSFNYSVLITLFVVMFGIFPVSGLADPVVITNSDQMNNDLDSPNNSNDSDEITAEEFADLIEAMFLFWETMTPTEQSQAESMYSHSGGGAMIFGALRQLQQERGDSTDEAFSEEDTSTTVDPTAPPPPPSLPHLTAPLSTEHSFR